MREEGGKGDTRREGGREGSVCGGCEGNGFTVIEYVCSVFFFTYTHFFLSDFVYNILDYF